MIPKEYSFHTSGLSLPSSFGRQGAAMWMKLRQRRASFAKDERKLTPESRGFRRDP